MNLVTPTGVEAEQPENKQRMFVITRRIRGFPPHLGINHWALVVGDTLWELDTDGDGLPFPMGGLRSQRANLKSRPVSAEDLKRGEILQGFEGWTLCSNEDIEQLADAMVKDWGAYNCFSANCRHFASKLFWRIQSVH